MPYQGAAHHWVVEIVEVKPQPVWLVVAHSPEVWRRPGAVALSACSLLALVVIARRFVAPAGPLPPTTQRRRHDGQRTIVSRNFYTASYELVVAQFQAEDGDDCEVGDGGLWRLIDTHT